LIALASHGVEICGDRCGDQLLTDVQGGLAWSTWGCSGWSVPSCLCLLRDDRGSTRIHSVTQNCRVCSHHPPTPSEAHSSTLCTFPLLRLQCVWWHWRLGHWSDHIFSSQRLSLINSCGLCNSRFHAESGRVLLACPARAAKTTPPPPGLLQRRQESSTTAPTTHNTAILSCSRHHFIISSLMC
jgi:hypothetical protein